jgi:Rrf2 family protein
MHLTRAADYAVRVMIHLAELPEGALINSDALARTAEVPPHFLGKVLQALARAQLVVSHRGASGGFRLGRPPSAVTILDVVEAVEGPIALNICLAGENACGRSPWCAAHDVWRQAQHALTSVLRAYSIARLAQETALLREGMASSLPPGGDPWS